MQDKLKSSSNYAIFTQEEYSILHLYPITAFLTSPALLLPSTYYM